MRVIIFLIFITILFLVSVYFLGLSAVNFILSIIFFFMAVLFSFNKKYYDKYFMFINPKYRKIMYEKDEKFKKRNRLMNIISWYILSVMMFINGLLRVKIDLSLKYKYNYEYTYKVKDLITIGTITLVFGIIAYFINNLFLKKSKNNGEYLGWSIIFGIVLTIIAIPIMLGILN